MTCSILFSALLCVAASSDEIGLYTDSQTGQIYTTPGENRVHLGDFTRNKSLEEILEEEAKSEIHVAEHSLEARRNWSDKLSIKGYMQFRHATFIDGEDVGYKLWSDGSVREDNANFLIRRARLIIAGKVGDHLGIYVQPDFASKGEHMGQLRDWYGDVFIDKQQIHRIRIGQSKVPYGFENMQSSSKRFAHDRNDALNSAVRDERDIGAFYYYTPVYIQDIFKEIDAKRLRGSGNYGMFAFGAYNGQGANKPELNDNAHVVSRFTYPIKLENGQFMEFGVQGYMGKYKPFTGDATALGTVPGQGIEDERFGVSAIIYPQPFGLQAEWNWGNTPGFDRDTQTIMKKSLNGGYVQAMYMIDDLIKTGDTFTTFAKWQYFDGYSKAEHNAPRNQVNDLELGTEWYPAKELRIQTVLHFMNRQDLTIRDPKDARFAQRFSGTAFKVQAQVNF